MADPGTAATPVNSRPWLDHSRSISGRVDSLLAQMTLEEKVQELYGVEKTGAYSAGYIPGNDRLGIPPIVLSDGPAGVKDAGTAPAQRPATALPAPAALAATFDPGLARTYGAVMGSEAKSRGVDVLYAPAMDIVRVPQGGRNFEYFSEDPQLTGAIAAGEVSGIQSAGVAAQVKHFAANNAENNRRGTSSDVDERTLREIYLPAWRKVLTGPDRAWSMMCANNMVNGVYNCENDELLNSLVKGDWGYDGVVGSDYAAVPDAIGAAEGGLDQAFTLRDWGEWYSMLPELVRRGMIPESAIDDHVRRVLTMMFRIGMFDGKTTRPAPDPDGNGAFARTVSEQSTVLLKNDGNLLPLDTHDLNSIAVVGTAADQALTGGGGSSKVTPYYSVSPVQGIRDRAGAGVDVRTADGSDHAAAAQLAKDSDVAVVVVNDVESEGSDRDDIDLPDDQDGLIDAVTAANPHTIVVLDTGSAITMPWLQNVPALLEAWYPGEEDGNALASVLFGDTNPSGKLPVTFPTGIAQSPTPGAPRYPADHEQYVYSEKLQVGYRWYDAQGLQPLFPFGFGLSYTDFSFSQLHAAPAGDGIDVTTTVTNTGDRTGTDVAQIYLGYPKAAGEPPKALKAFGRVTLKPGQHQDVHFHLSRNDLQIWDEQAGAYTVEPGRYTVYAGDSSRDLPQQQPVEITRNTGTVGLRLSAPPILGKIATIHATIRNTTDHPVVGARVHLQSPWSSTNRTVPAIRPHATVQISWPVSVPENARPGSVHFSGSVGAQPAHATSQLPYPDLAAAYNQVAITDDGDTSVLADIFGDTTYSAQGLRAGGFAPGGQLTHDGIGYDLPAVASGRFDNAAGAGQVIRLSGSGSRIGLLAAGVWGTQAGRVTVTYTDGSTSSTLLETPDWNAVTEGDPAATTSYIDNVKDGSQVQKPAAIYALPVPVTAGRTPAYLTLPGNSRFHIFSIGR
ncbi:MAG TPA: glycoside hydrolase family 3 C-terminal domain-containing protein [Mycobacteriales bacterium]|nr:glycoside hydrolase family 3 C-terminal domain-containing protein [Mycobacteriales bacterium]